MIIILDVDIWFCLCWLSVPFLGFFCPLCILRAHGGRLGCLIGNASEPLPHVITRNLGRIISRYWKLTCRNEDGLEGAKKVHRREDTWVIHEGPIPWMAWQTGFQRVYLILAGKAKEWDEEGRLQEMACLVPETVGRGKGTSGGLLQSWGWDWGIGIRGWEGVKIIDLISWSVWQVDPGREHSHFITVNSSIAPLEDGLSNKLLGIRKS